MEFSHCLFCVLLVFDFPLLPWKSSAVKEVRLRFAVCESSAGNRLLRQVALEVAVVLPCALRCEDLQVRSGGTRAAAPSVWLQQQRRALSSSRLSGSTAMLALGELRVFPKPTASGLFY